MIKKTFRLKDETAKWIQEGAKERKLGESEFLDLIAASWKPFESSVKETAEKVTVVAEELELPNKLLKITRDLDGLPVGFVRPRTARPDGSEEPWREIDWKKLEGLNVEIQGLRRDKLAEEVKKIRASRVKIESRLTASAKHSLDQEQDRAEVPNWCKRDHVSIETRSELEAHKAQCGVASLEYVVGLPEVRD